MSFQEFFEVEEGETPSQLVSVLTNKYVSTLISLFFGYLLSLGGYVNIWPLFGSANQLLAAMVLVSLAVFLKVTGRKGFMLYVPMVLMFIVTMTALVQAIYAIEAICYWWIHDHDRWFTVSRCRIISRSWTYDYFPFNW